MNEFSTLLLINQKFQLFPCTPTQTLSKSRLWNDEITGNILDQYNNLIYDPVFTFFVSPCQLKVM